MHRQKIVYKLTPAKRFPWLTLTPYTHCTTGVTAKLVIDLQVARFLPHRRCCPRIRVSTVLVCRGVSRTSTTLYAGPGPALSTLQHSSATARVTWRLVSTYAVWLRAQRLVAKEPSDTLGREPESSRLQFNCIQTYQKLSE